METDFLSLKKLFNTDQDFIKLIVDDKKLTEYYLVELVKLHQKKAHLEKDLIAYYTARTGITDINSLTILEMMQLSAFLVLVRYSPYARRHLHDFKGALEKCHRGRKVSIEIRNN